MSHFPVLLIDTVHPLLHEILKERGFNLVEAYDWNKEKIIQEIGNYKGLIIRSRVTIDKPCIDAATQLQFIARYGAGMENIDVAYAESKNIKCLHAAAGNKDAVAEHALGLLLNLFNKINKADAEVRKFQWLREENRGEELAGKTVGIMGYGNMGAAFAKRLQGFDVKVLVYDKYKSNYLQNNYWIEACSLERLQQESDVLSLHIPLTSETNGMCNYEWLNAFQKPFYLVNTARGKVLNTADALRLMKEKKIRGMCLDVLEFEDTSFEHLNPLHHSPVIAELFHSDQVVLTPHIAGWSHQSNVKLAQVLAKEIIDYCISIAD